ncbi:late embryogenesis abundant protein At1g64065-like [Sesamum indicum]|uniref:Late embryogenesis abundant protein At1g64065-like n=1 Tax=Sesamum indicum TaxID=4182 RepID=A0A6I9T7K7_SESIN|nr:late embryogenesis abundant protein At1g64065-like [Sesamum indicum]
MITVFVLVFLRVRTPKVRFGSLTVEALTLNSTTSTQPSLSMRLNTQVTVKNTNFGEFKFSESAISIVYRGNVVGSGVITGSGAGARSTKKLNVTVDVESKKDPLLGRDLNSGRVTVSSHATLEGRVHLFMIVKKKKTGTMNCTMDVDTRKRAVANFNCN